MKEATVCVVDDHAQVLASIANLLQAADFSVTTFGSAEAFLDHCTENGPEVVSCLVLDLRLPGMSGIELQEELTKRGFHIPIILISAHASRDVVELGIKNGASTMLEKPFGGRQLVDAVLKAISRGGS